MKRRRRASSAAARKSSLETRRERPQTRRGVRRHLDLREGEGRRRTATATEEVRRQRRVSEKQQSTLDRDTHGEAAPSYLLLHVFALRRVLRVRRLAPHRPKFGLHFRRLVETNLLAMERWEKPPSTRRIQDSVLERAVGCGC